MPEAVPHELIQKLLRYTRCTQKDVLACRHSIRYLSRDLPIFDSIWLDALVQARKLTPFQADLIATGREAELQAGQYQLIDRIYQDQGHLRYLAAKSDSQQLVLIEEYQLDQPLTPDQRRRLQELPVQLRVFQTHPEILSPLDILFDDRQVRVAYGWQIGSTVRELLVRRGRFPEKLMTSITRQLTAILLTLRQGRIVHGDIRAANLLMDRNGQLLLIGTGIRPLLTEHWTVQTRLPFEAYDTFAPETVQLGHWTMEADLYSAGCLLWQMCCGRPPLHSADAILKIKAHLTRTIPDVREYAPEIDARTATAIQLMTRKEPQVRQQFWNDLELQKSLRDPQTHLARRFVQEFEQPNRLRQLPGQRRFAATGSLPATLAILVIILLGIGWGFSNGLSAQWLTKTASHQLTSSSTVDSQQISETSTDGEKLIPLPLPDEQGLILLEPDKTYRADEISVVGPLKIATRENAERATAKIRVIDQAWRLWGTVIELDSLKIESVHSTSSQLQSATVCQSLNLSVSNCDWTMSDGDQDDIQSTSALAWKPLPQSDLQSGQLQLTDVGLYQTGTGIYVVGEAQSIHLQNVLKSGAGSLIRLAGKELPDRFPHLEFKQVTTRGNTALIQLSYAAPSVSRNTRQLPIEAENCIFDLAAEQSSLLILETKVDPREWLQQVQFRGQILLVPEQIQLSSWLRSDAGTIEPVKLAGNWEGFFSGEIQFAGRPATDPYASRVMNYAGPRWNSKLPGIEPELLLR